MIEQLDHELEAAVETQRRQWLEKRLRNYCVFSMVGSAVFLSVELITRAVRSHYNPAAFFPLGGMWVYVLNILLYWAILRMYRNKVVHQHGLVQVSFVVVTLSGLVLLLMLPSLQNGAVVPLIRFTDSPGESGVTFLGQILWLHGIASMFIPWTPRESRRALGILWAMAVLAHWLYLRESWGLRIVEWLLMLLAGVPGLFVCWLRHGRFRNRLAFSWLQDQYGQIKRELEQARAVHEMLFPRPQDRGPVCFQYYYEPMRQIGGDYLYVHRETHPDGIDRAMNLILIDVTGHGILAALTVNRIHGELDRLYAEKAMSPGEVLTALNHYFAITMSRHSIYATAIAMRIDPRQRKIEWANAGHPPALVVRRNGGNERMDSNAVMLGVLEDAMFSCATCAMEFSHDDRVFAYTDGAIEAADPSEKMLGIEGFEEMIQAEGPAGGMGQTRLDRIAEGLQRFRQGPPKDDTLMVEAFLTTTA